MITPKQIRAARAMLNWDSVDLAERTGFSRNTISNAEQDNAQTRTSTMDIIVETFRKNGIEFIEDEGVKLRSMGIEVFEGPERFEVFTDFLYNYLRINGGDCCLQMGNERDFQKYRKNRKLHTERMQQLVESGKITGRILCEEGDFKKTWADIRRLPKSDTTSPVSFYAFGDCLALISFNGEKIPYTVLHKSGPFAAAYIQAFNAAWEKAEVI